MDTIVRPPAPPLTETAPARRRRRWPWVVAVLVTLIVIAGTVGAIWLANIEPLVQGSDLFGPQSVHFSTLSHQPHVTVVDVNAFGIVGQQFKIPPSSHMRFTYLVTIRNEGPVPVEIIDVGDPPTSHPMFVTRRVVAMQDDHPGGEPDLTPFHPFTLGVGEQAALQMEVRVIGDVCQVDGTGWSWEPVTYRIWGLPWLTRHSDVVTGNEIQLIGKRPANC